VYGAKLSGEPPYFLIGAEGPRSYFGNYGNHGNWDTRRDIPRMFHGKHSQENLVWWLPIEREQRHWLWAEKL
jgi:hypothetical protein